MRIIYHHRTRSTDAQRIHILEMVKAFRDLGHEVEIVSLVPTETGINNPERDAENPWWQRTARKIPLAYEGIQLIYNLVGFFLLVRALVHERADFIYERYSLFSFVGVLTARLFQIPIVLETNSPFALEQQRDRDITAVRFARWTERVICNAATYVVVVSTPLKNLMRKSGVKSGKLVVMPNGVRADLLERSVPSEEFKNSLIGPSTRVVGFVGWFRRWHGLELLLDAFERSGLAGRAKVLLVGGGQAMAELRQYVNKRGLNTSVIFTGPVPHAEIPRFLDMIDIAVQPAANEYCCPMKILEYMALAKTIVAPRQENIQELLIEGEEAEYFEPGDSDSLAAALRSLVDDPERARRLGERARSAVLERGYLWTINAAKVVRMVEQARVTEGRSDANAALQQTSR